MENVSLYGKEFEFAGFGIKYIHPITTKESYIFYQTFKNLSIILLEENCINTRIKNYRWIIIRGTPHKTLDMQQLSKLVQNKILLKTPIKATKEGIEKILEQEYCRAPGEI